MNIYIENKDGALMFEGMIIPGSIYNKDYKQALEEAADGKATIEAWAGSDRDLESLRLEKIGDVKSECLKRIQAKVDAIDSIAMAKLIYRHMWPQPNPSSELLAGEAVYNYAAGKIAQANSATREQLEAYNPSLDKGWPV